MEILPLLISLFIFLLPIVAILNLNNSGYKWLIRVSEIISLWLFPSIFFALLTQTYVSVPCCDEPVADYVSNDYKIPLMILVAISNIFYHISSFRKTLLPPLIEVLTMTFLCLGFGLALMVALQMKLYEMEGILYFCGFILPILIFYLSQMYANFKRLQNLFKENIWAIEKRMTGFVWKILNLKLWQQIPIFTAFCVPLLFIFSGILLIFGQKPDALLLAFTDTYAGAFSQLKCDPQCHYDPHYLCTVASEGHPKLVKPLRKGYRRGQWIWVNRQLLVANAFEALFEKYFPKTHQIFRKIYDFLGTYIFRTHQTIRNTWVCDAVYVFMKGFEYIFVIVIYTCCVKPENHIQKQYLP